MTPEEERRIVEMFASELARGWIPKRTDIEDALNTVRKRRNARPTAA